MLATPRRPGSWSVFQILVCITHPSAPKWYKHYETWIVRFIGVIVKSSLTIRGLYLLARLTTFVGSIGFFFHDQEVINWIRPSPFGLSTLWGHMRISNTLQSLHKSLGTKKHLMCVGIRCHRLLFDETPAVSWMMLILFWTDSVSKRVSPAERKHTRAGWALRGHTEGTTWNSTELRRLCQGWTGSNAPQTIFL